MEARVALIRRNKPGVTAITSPTFSQPTGSYTSARSGSKVLILAENERGGYRAMTMPCYVPHPMWEWSGRQSGGDYIPNLPKESVVFLDESSQQKATYVDGKGGEKIEVEVIVTYDDEGRIVCVVDANGTDYILNLERKYSPASLHLH